VIHFQGLLTDEKGVPIGTDSPEDVYMRFSIVSEDAGFEPWSSIPRRVQVVDGFFAVRLGRFDPSERALDESIFTGNDGEGRRRFLQMEICTLAVQANCVNYNSNAYSGFFRKDLNEDLGQGDAASAIPVPGVPFIVSAVRVVGDDIKEGTLRISRDPDADGVVLNDLAIEASGAVDGMRIIQNQNLGLIIRQTDEDQQQEAFVVPNNNGQIEGSVYLKGSNSNIRITGSLINTYREENQLGSLPGIEEETTTRYGKLVITDRDPVSGYAVQAGPIFSPEYKNLTANPETGFTASITKKSRLHKLHIVDVNEQRDTMEVTVDAKGANVVQFTEDSVLQLSDQSRLTMRGTAGRELVQEERSIGLEALGFIDIDQARGQLNGQYTATESFLYQVIPHGTSVFNTLQFRDSLVLSANRLKGLIGTFDEGTDDFRALNNVYRDPITGQQLHKHDLRVGADPLRLIEKLNSLDGETLTQRIRKDRVDPQLAYIYDNNHGLTAERPFFTNINYFTHIEQYDPLAPLTSPSVITNDRLVARSDLDGNGVYLGGNLQAGIKSIELGSTYAGMTDFHFVNCASPLNCVAELDKEFDTIAYLDLRGGQLSLQRSLVLTTIAEVNNSGQIYGDLILQGDYENGGDNFTELELFTNPVIQAIAPNYIPIIHDVVGTTFVKKKMQLSQAPVVNTSFRISGVSFAEDLLDEGDNTSLHHVDPDQGSYINALRMAPGATGGGELTVEDDVFANSIASVRKVVVGGSMRISQTLSSNRFIDFPDANYRLDPYPDTNIGSTASKLNNLTLLGNLTVLQDTTVGNSFVSTSDFESALDLTLTNGSFVSRESIRLSTLEDLQNPNYDIILNQRANLHRLQLRGNVFGRNITSSSNSTTLSVAGNVDSQALSVVGSSVFVKRFLDRDDLSYSVDPESQSTLSVLLTTNFYGYYGFVRTSANFSSPTSVSSQFSVARTLTVSGFADIFSKIYIRNGANTNFELNREGDIVSARSLTLSSGYSLIASDSLATISQGLVQNSNDGSNILSNTTARANVFLMSSSLEVSNKAFFLTSDGHLSSVGELSLQTAVRAGMNSLKSTIRLSSTSAIFEGAATTFVLQNQNPSLQTPLNIRVKTASIKETVYGSNLLQTPLLRTHDGNFQIDPTSITRLYAVSMIQKGGSIGGGLSLSSPLHLSSFQDADLTTLSLDASGLTTLTRLSARSSYFLSGIQITAKEDKSVLLIRPNATTTATADLIALENGLFHLSETGLLQSSGNVNLSGNFLIEGSRGLVFTSSTNSVPEIDLTSEVLYLLVGKNLQIADSLHQHSVINGHPLTDMVRRDIDNILTQTNTFTSSGYNLILQPITSSLQPLFVQLDPSNSRTIVLSSDGSLRARVFQGDGRFLNSVQGDDIVDASLSSQDFQSNSLNSRVIADNIVSTSKVARKVLQSSHVIDGSIQSTHLIDRSFTSQYIQSQTLQNEDFASSAVRREHIGRKSITEQKIANRSLGEEVFESQSIVQNQLIADSIRAQHFETDQVRLYHLSANSIETSKILSKSIFEQDLKNASVGVTEINSLQIDSRVIQDLAISMAKIVTSAIDSSKIVSRSLIHQDFKTASITLDKVTPLSITSREILDYTLTNADFRDLSITRAKLATDSIRTMHMQTSSIQSNQLAASQVITRNIVLKTITSSEILNESILNQDVLSDTLNPSNFAVNSIQSNHIRTRAITRIKIATSGIGFSRFQPFAFIESNISASSVTNGNLMQDSILTRHIINNSLLQADVMNASIQGEKIKDYSVLTENIKTRTISADNILASAVRTHHFVADSLASIDIATSTLTTNRFADSSVLSIHIGTGEIQNQHFYANAAGDLKFAADSIDTSKIISYSLLRSNFALNSVTEGKITSETLLARSFRTRTLSSADIGSVQILSSHINTHALTEEKILTSTLISRNFGPQIFSTAKIQNLTLTNSLFATDSVSNQHIDTSAIDSRVIQDASILGVDIASFQISQRLIAPTTITSDSVLFFSLTSRVMDSSQIIDSKFAANSIKTTNIVSFSITGALIATNSLLAKDILSYTIEASDIATAAITASKLKSNIVSSTHIIDGSINETHLIKDLVITRHIRDLSIISAKIATETLLSENFNADTLLTQTIGDYQIENHHIARDQITADKIDGNLPVSLFRSNSVTGGVIQDSAVTAQKLVSRSFAGYLLQNQAITQSKIKSNTLTDSHLENGVITTAKMRSGIITNDHLVDFIIESTHVINGSLQTSDVRTRSLPGDKFVSGVIHSKNVSDGNILTEHIYDSVISGDLFAAGSILAEDIGVGIVTKDKLKDRSLEKRTLTSSAITASKFANHFMLARSNIKTDAITSSMIASYNIRPNLVQKNSLDASKIASVAGINFMDRTIPANKIANNAVTGIKIVSDTFFEQNLGLLYVNSTGQIKRTSQQTPGVDTWSVNAGLPVPKYMAVQSGSSNQFAYTSGANLFTRNTSDGASESLLFNFGAKWGSRYGFGLVNFSGKLWLFGGTDGTNYFDDVWSSDDGFLWEQEQSAAAFGERAGFVSLVFGGRIYVVAGENSGGARNDVYSSNDGINWTQETAGAAFSNRSYASGTVFDDGTNKMWLFGGQNGGTPYEDVYYSTDGSTWTQVNKDLKMEVDAETVLWIQSDTTDGNTSFTDLSDTPHTVSRTGNSAHETTDAKPGFGTTSILMPSASSSSLTVADHTDFDFSSGNFTMEMWVNIPNTTGDKGLMGQLVDTSNRWEWEIKGSDVSLGQVIAGTDNSQLFGATLSANTWTHLALTYDGTYYELFVNGSSVSTRDIGGSLANISATLEIGHTDAYINGLIDEVRITRSVLYTANFTPRSRPYYRRWKRSYSASATFNDGGGNAMWLIAGLDDTANYTNDVWKTTDGQDWIPVDTVPTIFSARHGHQLLVHNSGSGDELYVIGGEVSGPNQEDDVWKTSNGTNWSQVTAASGWAGQKSAGATVYNSGAGNQIWILGGETSGGASQQIYSSTNASSWGAYDSVAEITDLDWIGTNQFIVTVLTDLPIHRVIDFNSATSASNLLSPMGSEVKKVERKDATKYLGIDSNDNLLFSTNANFNFAQNIGEGSYDYKLPNFSPFGDAVFAVKELGVNNEVLVRIPWNGGSNFGTEINLTEQFSEENTTYSDLKISPDGTEIYFLGSIPQSASTSIFKISTSGSGLTTIAVSNPSGGILILDGEKYNPYLPDNTIETNVIKNRSIPVSKIVSYTIKQEDFASGGIDKNSFAPGSLVNSNFANGSVTAAKWRTRSIANVKLADDIFTSNKITNRTLDNRVMEDAGLGRRAIQDDSFSNAQVQNRDLQREVIRNEGYQSAKVGTNLTDVDIASGSIQGVHLSSLTSAAIADDSISSRKFTSRVLTLTHFGKNTLEDDDINPNSVEGNRFQTNQLEAYLLEDDSVTSAKIASATLKRNSFAANSVGVNNIADENILSTHLKSGIFSSAQMANDAVTTRTLRESSITSDLLAEDSIVLGQFTADSIPSRAFASHTIQSAKLQDSIFESSHFGSGSLTNSDWILDGTLLFDQIPFSAVNETKLDGAVSLDSSYFVSASFEGQGISNLTAVHVKDGEVEQVHIQEGVLTTAKVQDNAITATQIAAGALQERHFAADSVDQNSFVDGKIESQDIANDTLLNAKIANTSIANDRFADNRIETAKITNNSLQGEDLANSAVIRSKIQSFSLLEADFQDGAVTAAKIINGSLTSSVVDDGSLTSRVLALNTFTTSDFGSREVTAGSIKPASILSQDIVLDSIENRVIGDGQVTEAKVFHNDNFTKLLLRSNSTDGSTLITDASEFRHTITTFGSLQHSTTQKKFFDTALNFNGSTDYLRVPDSADWTPGTGNWSLDFWVYRRSNGNQNIWYQFNAEADKFRVYLKNGDIDAEYKVNNNSLINFTGSTLIPMNEWTHVALVRSGTNMLLFQGGILRDTIAILDPNTDGRDMYDIVADVYIGAKYNGTNEHYDGFLEELRWSKGVARWTENFIPPDYPYQNITGDKFAAGAIQSANLAGNIGSEQLIAGSVGDDKISDGVITGDKIIDGTVDGADFADDDIPGSAIKHKTMVAANVAADAVTEAKVSNTIDLTGKISATANIATAKVQDDQLGGVHMDAVLGNGDTQKMASGAITSAKLNASVALNSNKVVDGSVTAAKIDTGTLDTFDANTLTAADFNSASTPDSNKFANDSITGNKVLSGTITAVDILGTSDITGSAVIQGTLTDADFGTQLLGVNDIKDGTISSLQISNTGFLSTNQFPATGFSASKLEAISSDQIADGIFTASHFASNFFLSKHLGDLTAVKFQANSFNSSKIQDLSLVESAFDANVFDTDQLANSAVGNTKLADGSIEEDNVRNGAITTAKFQNTSLAPADINDASNNFNGNTNTSHQHSPFTFTRANPASGYTFLDTDNGRANFSYKIYSADSPENARTQCKDDNAQVCSVDQLIDVCRNSNPLGTTDYYVAGNPTYTTQLSQEYLVFPALQFNNCYTPNLEYNLEYFAPVNVNASSSTGITDVFYHDTEAQYFYQISDAVYSSAGQVQDANKVTNGEIKTGAPFRWNIDGTKQLVTWNADRIKTYNATSNEFELSDNDGWYASAEEVVTEDASQWVAVKALDNTRFAVTYSKTSDSDLYVRMGRVEGNSIVFGTELEARDGTTVTYTSIDKFDSNNFVISYGDADVEMIVVKSSGDLSPTACDTYRIDQDSYWISVSALSSTQMIFAYQYSGDDNPYVKVGQVTDFANCTETSGSYYETQNQNATRTSIAALSSTKAVLAKIEANGKGNLQTVNISGNSISSVGTEVEFEGNTSTTNVSIQKVSDTRVLVHWSDTLNGEVQTADISGNTITMNGSPVSYSASDQTDYLRQKSVALLSETTFVVAYSDNASNKDGFLHIGHIASDGSITMDTTFDATFNSRNTYDVTVSEFGNGEFIVAFRDDDDSGKVKVRSYKRWQSIQDLSFFNSDNNTSHGYVAYQEGSENKVGVSDANGNVLFSQDIGTNGDVRAIEARHYYSGDTDRRYTGTLFFYDTAQNQTEWRYIYTNSMGAFGSGNAGVIESGDVYLNHHCPETSHCYISTSSNSGNVYHLRLNPPSNTGPGPTLDASTLDSTYGGETLAGLDIVSMDSSTVAGSGSGNRYLYMLANNGDVFRIKLDDDGSSSNTLITGGSQIEKMLDTNIPTGTYSAGSARIRVVDGNNDHILFTGLDNHVIAIRAPSRKYACCSAGMR